MSHEIINIPKKFIKLSDTLLKIKEGNERDILKVEDKLYKRFNILDEKIDAILNFLNAEIKHERIVEKVVVLSMFNQKDIEEIVDKFTVVKKTKKKK